MFNLNFTKEGNQPKPMVVNIVFTMLELVCIAVYMAFGLESIVDAIGSFDVVGMYDDVNIAIWCLSIVVLIYSVFFLSVKSLRTPYVKNIALSNLAWVAFNIVGLIG